MTGHHINKDGDFQSDKYAIQHIDALSCAYKHKFSECGLNKLVLSFKDKEARIALRVYAEITPDRELGEDILTVLNNK